MRRAVFLDRDGTINRCYLRDGKTRPPQTVEQFELLAGAAEAVQRLRKAGFLIVVVTNQPDVAAGQQSLAMAERLNDCLRSAVRVDAVYSCYHVDADRCACRKPLPGMLLAAAEELHIDLAHSFMVGDRWRDIGAGQAAGCFSILLETGPKEGVAVAPDATAASLSDAASLIVEIESSRNACVTRSKEASMRTVTDLKVKLFADGADLAGIREMATNPLIKGFTTNPTLMRKAGVTDYRAFALDVLSLVPDRPISFEVFADEFDAIERQARAIAAWGRNINVKIPVTNTRGEFAGAALRRLSVDGVVLNVTAVMTLDQVARILDQLDERTPAIVSIFAGRIADTGRDPVPIMAKAVEMLRARPKCELIWASPRELLNIFQADAVGCHIITATNDILKKLSVVGKNLDTYSLETVQMFHRDASAAGFTVDGALPAVA